MTWRALTLLARDQRGNVGVTFALTLLPLMACLGAAVDYSLVSSAHSRLQVAVDAAAVTAAKLPSTTAQATFEAQATKTTAAVLNDSVLASSLAVTPTRAKNSVTVAASASVATPLASLIGYRRVPISAQSTVEWGNTRLRVALALDVTGSMASDGKMTALRTAAQNLLNQLKAAATTDGDVYVSIIPFAKSVNVGASNYNQPWVKWSGSSDTWDENNGTCSRVQYRTRATCLWAGRTWTPAAHNTWNGCVMDRDENYDTVNTAPTTWATNFPAEQYDYCPAQLMGLSYNWTALSSKIASLQPAGGTNQAIGLAWAFQSLTASPFTIPAKDPNYQYNDVIILLSDGLNTQNRVYGNGSDPSSQVDARQRLLCSNVKAAGIMLYTVQVNTDNAPTSTLLKSCASDEGRFFLLTSSSQIITTFAEIGTRLSGLMISR